MPDERDNTAPKFPLGFGGLGSNLVDQTETKTKIQAGWFDHRFSVVQSIIHHGKLDNQIERWRERGTGVAGTWRWLRRGDFESLSDSKLILKYLLLLLLLEKASFNYTESTFDLLACNQLLLDEKSTERMRKGGELSNLI